jgi:DNA repair protein RadC
MTNKPYEKFKELGANALSNEELLAIILRTGTSNKPALKVAEEVLDTKDVYQGKLMGLYHKSLKELMEIDGIGEVKAIKLKCLTELSLRMAKERLENRVVFTNPSDIAEYYMETCRHLEVEKVFLLCLDNQLRLIKEYELSKGTINTSLISPREVFIEALNAKAVYILLIHNHPSGNPSPSKADIQITLKVVEAGKIIDIKLLDHIIIGDHSYVSLKEQKIL